MSHFWEYIGLSFAGYLFHLLKQWGENIKRGDKFRPGSFAISFSSNILAIFILNYLALKAPSDWLVMSPVMAILIGVAGSSMLNGIINTRMPKDTESIKPSAPNDEEIKNS